jgi:hypothetical protein
MVPVSALRERSKYVKLVNCPIWVGMVPVSALLERYKAVKLVNRPIWVGMVPVSALPERLRDDKLVNSPIWVGTVPFSALAERYNVVKFVNSQIWVGILPISAFLVRSKVVKLVNSPIWVGMVPVAVVRGRRAKDTVGHTVGDKLIQAQMSPKSGVRKIDGGIVGGEGAFDGGIVGVVIGAGVTIVEGKSNTGRAGITGPTVTGAGIVIEGGDVFAAMGASNSVTLSIESTL